MAEYKNLIEEAIRLRESDLRKENDWIGVARTAQRLGLSKNHVRGHVIVIGHGLGFPERLLLGIPESGYTVLRKEVTSLILCDSDSEGKLLKVPNLINNWLELPPVIIPFLDGNYCIKQEPGSYVFVRSDARSFLNCYKELSADTIMFFCAGKELRKDGLGVLLAERLRPGGYIMGSGFFSERTELFLPDLESEKLVELGEPIGVENNSKKNLAFLARKPA